MNNTLHKAAAIREFFFEQGCPRGTVSGSSMSPGLVDGAMLTIQPVTETLQTGRIYLFRYGGAFFLHRLAGTAGKTCYFIGDASWPFERVDCAAVVGLSACAEPPIRYCFFLIMNYLILMLYKSRQLFLSKTIWRIRIRLSCSLLKRKNDEKTIP